MSRRALLRGLLAVAAAPAFGVLAPRAAAATGTVRTWRWVALPDSGGLQVFVCAPAALTSTPIDWTPAGQVSAPALGLSVVAGPDPVTTMNAASCGLTVRRILT